MVGYIWKGKLPLKIKFFLWQIFNNKLQVAQSLIKKGLERQWGLLFVWEKRTSGAYFFKCHIAKFVRCMIEEVFNMQAPKSLEDFLLGRYHKDNTNCRYRSPNIYNFTGR